MKPKILNYSDETFEQIKEIIKINSAQVSSPVSYSVYVDDSPIIWRTDDPTMLDVTKKFIDKNTNKIIVSIYAGKSNFNFKYILENVKDFLA